MNDAGETVVELLRSKLESETQNKNSRPWHVLLQEVKRREVKQLEDQETQANNRSALNAMQTLRQRRLARNARNAAERNRDGMNGWNTGSGLGTMDDGIGYFPSLVALQFQGNIPAPSASFVDIEKKEKRRLELIVKSIGLLVILSFLYM